MAFSPPLDTTSVRVQPEHLGSSPVLHKFYILCPVDGDDTLNAL